MHEGDISGQTRVTLENLKAVDYRPARTTVAAKDLLCGVLVDIDVIAVV